MLRKAAICALLATAVVVAGCGSSDDSTSGEDTQAITELVAKLNQATRDRDAAPAHHHAQLDAGSVRKVWLGRGTRV